MNRFFIMTRGRTGSTAIMDVLGKISSVYTPKEQEIFIQHEFSQIRSKFTDLRKYPSVLPFVLWETCMPDSHSISMGPASKRAILDRYLHDAEQLAANSGARAFGFKVLSNHFDENPMLMETLLERGYRAIYLKRNIPHQVISGMIAKLRGMYNTRKEYKDDARYEIDINEFKSLVEWESRAVEKDVDFLTEAGFKHIVVTYEEFMTERVMFFDKVLAFIGVVYEQPQESSYSVMIKELRRTVMNYEAVAECARSLGMALDA